MATQNECPDAHQEELRRIVDRLLQLERRMDEILGATDPQPVNPI